MKKTLFLSFFLILICKGVLAQPACYSAFDIGPESSSFVTPYDINDSGHIVGYYVPATGIEHAFLYNGTFHDLGTFGGNDSIAYGINSSGKVVGYAEVLGNQKHAFLYDGTMHDLGQLSGDETIPYDINDSDELWERQKLHLTVFIMRFAMMEVLMTWEH